MRFRVKAPYVTATLVDEAGGEHVQGFYGGMFLPPHVKPESAEILVTKGMAEKIKAVAAEPEPAVKADADDAEAGSLEETLKKQAAEAAKATPKKAAAK